MNNKNLAVLGSPYHPVKDFEKIRNVPMCYCIIFDLEKLIKKI